jgi:hypothetical protein
VVRELEGLEIRRYPARIVAETAVEGTFDEARAQGFERLAGYLFGQNFPEEKLPMTTPVSLSRRPAKDDGERLAMTTPVTIGRSPVGYVMRFHLPKDRVLESLPLPNDDRVRLRPLESEMVAALRFRGSYDGARIEEKQRELLDRVRKASLTTAGEPTFAGYDSPATLPALRRVEVWVPIAGSSSS